MFAGLFGSQSRARKTSVGPPRPALLTPLPHPLPHKHLAVAVYGNEGLVLFPEQRAYRHAYTGKAALIPFGLGGNARAIEDFNSQSVVGQAACSSYGVLGILKLFQETYLLLVSSRRTVGRYVDSDRKSINCLTGILAVPLSQVDKARAVLSEESDRRTDTHTPLERSQGGLSDISRSSAASSAESSDEEDLDDSSSASQPPLGTDASTSRSSAKAKDAAKTSLPFGLGRLLWPNVQAKHAAEASQLVNLANVASPPGSATSPAEALDVANNAQVASSAETAGASQLSDPEAAAMRELDKKILKEALAELTNGAMYFSHDFDLTRCTQTRWQQLKEEKASATSRTQASERRASLSVETVKQSIDLRLEEPSPLVSLAKRADRRFWWNNWLSKPLLDAGLDEYVTVLMQGFVQVQNSNVECTPDNKGISPKRTDVPLSLAIISRRSVERPGLRYQRRGVNASGGVANFVETEFLLSCELGGKHQISSYVQTRGSIPLFWSQSPWSLKPVPILERTIEENCAAISKHFNKQVRHYFGKVIVVNLAEKEGNEGKVVKAYRDAVAALDTPNVAYTEWDFHNECRGMKYENISKLLGERAADTRHLSSFWSLDSQKLQLQHGVFRINCMDCLDRTNVVQSAFARDHLSTFLIRSGIGPLSAGSKERLDVSFNALFADNGDAISRTYAGTSALKGDFVRSGKRNWRGQLNDATNSIARFYQNTILDFFKQSMIDYVTGVNLNAFAEFSEKMQSSDPGEIVRIASIRKSAIETSAKTVLNDGETQLHGWTLLSPSQAGHVKDTAFEEQVLLLTRQAVYCCSYEYTLQKVRTFMRIPLGQIVGIQKGEYILSALEPSARDTEENYGLCLEYLAGGTDSRSRTYSIRNKSAPHLSQDDDATTGERLRLAFKALRGDLIRDLDSDHPVTRRSCRKQVEEIVDQIRQACEDVGGTDNNDDSFIKTQPIVSLAEAKAQVGLLERLSHDLKHMIWL